MEAGSSLFPRESGGGESERERARVRCLTGSSSTRGTGLWVSFRRRGRVATGAKVMTKIPIGFVSLVCIVGDVNLSVFYAFICDLNVLKMVDWEFASPVLRIFVYFRVASH